MVCSLVSPFCGALYGDMKELQGRCISKKLSVESICCIEMWRVFLALAMTSLASLDVSKA